MKAGECLRIDRQIARGWSPFSGAKSMGFGATQNGGRNHAESGTLVLTAAKHMARMS